MHILAEQSVLTQTSPSEIEAISKHLLTVPNWYLFWVTLTRCCGLKITFFPCLSLFPTLHENNRENQFKLLIKWSDMWKVQVF